ncbi:MAG: trehalose-phosphatase [Rhodospirillaceae bacterium]|nr:trehalose-phosphatase [Rhodospirillaceae bacterium]MDD9924590.1 trehalose-phosphatase [Rhodospirillaceae bacterium]
MSVTGRNRALSTHRPLSAPAHRFSREIALFLDVDGTLLEFADTPDAVAPAAGLPALLRDMAQALGGALALISGRPVGELDRIFAPLHLPAAGQHGLEWRGADGLLQETARGPALDEIRAGLKDFAAQHEGALLEDKGIAVALHYRLAPGAETEARGLVERLLADRDDLHCLAGKMVFEVKPRGVDKGVAITRFMGAAPFGGRVPVFVGDDVTDEDGFRAVNDAGGISIRVGRQADSAAQFALPDVTAVREWLGAVLTQLKKDIL